LNVLLFGRYLACELLLPSVDAGLLENIGKEHRDYFSIKL